MSALGARYFLPAAAAYVRGRQRRGDRIALAPELAAKPLRALSETELGQVFEAGRVLD